MGYLAAGVYTRASDWQRQRTRPETTGLLNLSPKIPQELIGREKASNVHTVIFTFNVHWFLLMKMQILPKPFSQVSAQYVTSLIGSYGLMIVNWKMVLLASFFYCFLFIHLLLLLYLFICLFIYSFIYLFVCGWTFVVIVAIARATVHIFTPNLTFRTLKKHKLCREIIWVYINCGDDCRLSRIIHI